MSDQHADLEWRDGAVPVSTRFDDPYFSLENGLAETRHVFLTGNDLPARFALVVEIDAGEMEVELYAEVQAAVAAMNAIEA